MRRKKILVVDDEENLRALYEGEFSEEGYKVVTASSGEEAISMLESEMPDLVTLDIKMPGMGGIAALGAIRDKDPKLPVIMLTAYPEFKRDFDVWAADAYLTKTADLTELKAKVAFLLANEVAIKPVSKRKVY